MMSYFELAEAIGLPTQHVGLYFVDRVPARRSPQAANRFPPGPLIDFGRTSDMKLWIGFDFLHSSKFVINVSSTDAKFGIALKMCEALCKIGRLQAQVAIELDNKIPITAPKSLKAIIKRLHYSATRLAETSVLSVNNAYPWVLRGIAINNLARPGGRPVIDDHLLRRQYCLGLHGRDGSFNKRVFIADRRNNYVSAHCLFNYSALPQSRCGCLSSVLSLGIQCHNVMADFVSSGRRFRALIRPFFFSS